MTEENKEGIAPEQVEQKPGVEQLQMPKVICEKHGDVGPHHFTLHAPEFGYDQVHLCLICAFEYASMVCSPVRAEYPEDPYKVEGGTEEDIATPVEEEKKDE
jgi:hypothetical protein